MASAAADWFAKSLQFELAEAREQQAATAEILRVISSSPMDLRRAFADIAESAARLCDYDAAIHRVDGDSLPVVAHHGPIPIPSTVPLTAGFFVGCAVLDRRTIQVADMQAEGGITPKAGTSPDALATAPYWPSH